MLIATCKPPKINRSLYPRAVNEVGIGSLVRELVVGQYVPRTIGAFSASPHDDSHYSTTDYFVSLTLETKLHTFGDTKHYPRELILEKGSIFVVNPTTLHWLYQDNPLYGQATRRAQWVAVQWEVPKGRLKSFARALVEKVNGKWATAQEAGAYAYVLPSR
jgi:hypothetical protein